MIKPVYPKENPEHRQQVLQAFYKKVRETSWESCDENERPSKPRGRKPKEVKRPESRPRSEGERKVAKQQGYNWFEKWEK